MTTPENQKPSGDPASDMFVFDYSKEIAQEGSEKKCKTCKFFISSAASKTNFRGAGMSICIDERNPGNKRKGEKAVVFPNSTCDNHEFREAPEMPDMIA
jgi:hypothetical protein